MEFKTIDAKSVLVKSKLPDTDYVVNPYVGCQFSCVYCYASFMGRFIGGETIENWGNYVYAKTNSISVFKKEYLALKKRGITPSIFLSSVTDPYQGIEKKHRLTRGILEILAMDRYPGIVSILTKSPLVLRDIDLFEQLPKIEVGLTITSTNDTVSRFFEIKAPSIHKRLYALQELNKAKIKTYAFIGPLLPHFVYAPEELEALVASISETGVSSVYVEHLNVSPYIVRRLNPYLKEYSIGVQDLYKKIKTSDYKDNLTQLVYDLLKKYNMNLRLNEVLSHRSCPDKQS